MSRLNWPSWFASAQPCQTLSPLWCLCFIAITAFGVSSVLALTAAKSVARFSFALVSVVTASVVQKLTVLALHLALFRRKRFSPAVIMESALSDWPESCLVIAAVLKGMPDVAHKLLIGFVAVKHFLLLGVCSLSMGHQERNGPYPKLTSLLHTRLLAMSVPVVLIPTAAGLALEEAEQSVVILCYITAIALLLLSIRHFIVVCRVHSRRSREACGLRGMVLIRDDSADFDTFSRRPTLQITSYVAERFQKRRDAYLGAIAKDSSKPISDRGNGGDNAVNLIILAASCAIILVSSVQLVDSVTPEDTEWWSAWQRVNTLLVTFFAGLTGCVAAYVYKRKFIHALGTEEVISAALGSTARLVSVILPISTLVGWALHSGPSVMPFDVFHGVLLLVALLIQLIGKGRFVGSVLLTLYVLFAGRAWLGITHITILVS